MQLATERLELDAIKEAIAQRVRTPLGSSGVEALGPFPEIGVARERIELVRQARGLLERSENPPVEGASNVRASLELGKKGATLDGASLRAVAKTMKVGSTLRRFLLSHEERAPGLYGIGASLKDLTRQANAVLGSFDPDGRLSDDASRDLGALRKRLVSLKEALEERISELLTTPTIKPYLRESYFTVRADRYVVPITASFKNEVKGIVHDASGSGQTVFIEPQAIVNLGNRLKIAQSEVTEEEQRILGELTELVVEEADGIETAMSVVQEIDLITGCARFADDLHCAPIIPDPIPRFDLLGARHPLLQLQQLAKPDSLNIPNDLGLQDGQVVLVLTGPNTGGKTVALKTIGLFALMVRCGLHLPCSPDSRIGWFSKIEATIGDQQSIATNLSTFAAHILDLMRTLGRADSDTLVLLDEIAGDTDPTQGQALAQALLEAFADRKSHTVVTTHFERLKALPFADPRFRNAGVGFDPVRLRPTYRISLDTPQSSSGLDIAQSLGLAREIVDRARELTGEGAQELESLMKSLQHKTHSLLEAKLEVEEKKKELEEERKTLAAKNEELEETRQKLVEGDRRELLEEIQTTRDEVRKIIATLQTAVGTDAIRDAMRMATDSARQLDQVREEEKQRLSATSKEPERVPLQSCKVGDWVHVRRLKKDGEVVATDGDDVLVAIGNMRTRVPVNDLELGRWKRPKRETRANLRKAIEEIRSKPGEFQDSEELDVRGHTIEESLGRLDAFFDHHYRGNALQVRIIHGHGTGALRNAIREYLGRSGYVKLFRPGEEHEGGDGATVATLA